MKELYLILLAPLIGFLLNAFLGKLQPNKSISAYAGSAFILSSFLSALILFMGFLDGTQPVIDKTVFNWIHFNELNIGFGFLLDQLSATWLMVITGVGFLIHVYSIGYMHDDENSPLFFAYLNLFIFFMLLLALGNNLLVTFIGWEGVGLCSYLLIGFWFKNQDYNNAAKKAFIMNRIGDLGFLIGMFMILFYFKTLNYLPLQNALVAGAAGHHGLLVAITIALFIGAVGKSAQIPLYTWLPDAMAGPTPVSALIHAATMVTAGIYMIARTHFLYLLAPETLQLVAWVGAITALFAATIGLAQNDIKKVLAYSTVSQLGLMFMALGVTAFTSGVFHVVTHAFFKACLFLGAGSVIHGLGGEQDIRKMGGLRKWMPITFWTFLISSLAISGIFPFAGFFSKDEILAATFEHNKILWAIGSLASAFTAFYMFRLVFLTFTGEFRGSEEQKHHLHESPKSITFPLIILAFLAAVGGFMGLPKGLGFHHGLKNFLAPVFAKAMGAVGENPVAETSSATGEIGLMAFALVLALIAIGIAYWRYVSKKAVPANDPGQYGLGKLIYNKFYIDEIYNAIFVKPVMFFSGMFYNLVDRIFIDGIVTRTARFTLVTGNQVRKLQSGYIGFYLMAMVFSMIIILLYAFIIK